MRRRKLLEWASLGFAASYLSPALAAFPTNPWRNRPINNRLLSPLYRPPGSSQFLPTNTTKIWSTVSARLASIRTSTWSTENRRAEGLSFYLSQDLTNEEAYTWAKLARILGGQLERQGEAMALAVARGFESTFGQPAAPNHWLELAHSRTILLLGDLNQPYPAKQMISKRARLFQATPTPDRALGGSILSITPQSEIALLGGLIRYILENRLYDSAYLQANTNALNLVVGNLTSKEITYEFQEDRLARAKALEDEGTVFALLMAFYAPYRPNTVSQLCGLPESAINNFYREVTVSQNRPLSIVYAQETSSPLLCEQKIRAAGIISLLLGQVGQPGGGIVTLAPGWNPQGTTDVGALGDSLPGYSGPAPQSDEDFILWTQSHSLNKARRTIAFLRSWYDLPDNDFGFSLLPTAKPNAAPEMLICVGAVPKLPLDRLRTLVVLTTNAQIPAVSAKTEVFMLPLAHPTEREGTITDTGRRIVLFSSDRRPSGQSQTGLTLAAGLWSQVSARLAKSSEERDRGIAAVRWPRVLSVETVIAEMGGENLREPGQITRSEQVERCGVPVYAGLSLSQLRLRSSSEVDDSRIGLYPNYGFCWPGDIHIIGNRASADSKGQSKGFIGWDGKRWSGLDTPDVVDPLKSPEESVDPFRGTPEGVARLIAVEYAGGLNLDTGIALERGIVPKLGFLPAKRDK
ncbi:MAG: molybdopterin-dependent oxidoreductase [Anaerolineae bacterium]|nr:molybdopterin-dependent oxidoreductase [Gloeobacterales cyanobacterium ES-bin-313]